MALWMWLLIVLAVFAAAIVLYRHYKESCGFPPGPLRFPLVGSLPSFPFPWNVQGSDIIIHFTQFSNKYEQLMGLFIGPSMRGVLVNDFELAKLTAFNEVFSGKIDIPKLIEMRGINGRQVGIILTRGKTWKANRKFSLLTLRDIGLGKKRLGTIITEEVTSLIETFKSKSGQDVLIHQNFNVAVLNILWSMVASKKFQYGDPQILEVQNQVEMVYKYISIDILFPWLRYIYPGFHNRTKQYFKTMTNMFRTTIDEHACVLNNEGKPKDFIEAYLREMKVNADLTKDDLVGICFDFFEAGSEIIGVTLEWIMMYLARYPDVQEKCYLELQSVMGGNFPTLDDRPCLPYCEATIMEVQRLSCVIPCSLDRRAVQDTILGGYNIPKDTYLLFNIWKFHHDPEYFPDPWMFSPERFLSADGNIVNKEHLISFGMGKRKCMGESFAKAELFLFFTIMVQVFKVSLAKEHKAPSEDECKSIFLRTPLPFYVHIMTR